MNIELLKRVQTRLRRMKHAEHFCMAYFGDNTACGTSACISGHALLLSGYKLTDYDTFISPKGRAVDPSKAARRLLRLTWDQGTRLFIDGCWPEEFRYDDEDNYTVNDPKVAASRIQAFIDSGGAR